MDSVDHEQVTLTVNWCALQGAARNRLLVKGGSSFNALVRAMKQDLVENGTAAKDPALLYEIDKVGFAGLLLQFVVVTELVC